MSNTVIKSPVVYGKSNNVIVAFDSTSAMSIHINGIKIPLTVAKGKSKAAAFCCSNLWCLQ